MAVLIRAQASFMLMPLFLLMLESLVRTGLKAEFFHGGKQGSILIARGVAVMDIVLVILEHYIIGLNYCFWLEYST